MKATLIVSGATPAELLRRAHQALARFDPDADWRYTVDAEPLAYNADGTVAVWQGNVTADSAP